MIIIIRSFLKLFIIIIIIYFIFEVGLKIITYLNFSFKIFKICPILLFISPILSFIDFQSFFKSLISFFIIWISLFIVLLSSLKFPSRFNSSLLYLSFSPKIVSYNVKIITLPGNLFKILYLFVSTSLSISLFLFSVLMLVEISLSSELSFLLFFY